MKIKMHVSGLRELDKAMEDLDLDIRKRAARAAGKRAMEPILKRAQALVPVDQGHLKETIKLSSTQNIKSLRKERKGAFLRTRVATGRTRRTPKGGYQALQVEFGTSKSRAQPFMRPAIMGAEKRTIIRFKHSLKASVEKGVRSQIRRNKRRTKK